MIILQITPEELKKIIVDAINENKSTIESNNSVPFLSLDKTKELLDCSRTFVYNLINSGKLTPRYVGRKPYFFIDEIIGVMTLKPTEEKDDPEPKNKP